MSLRTAPGQPGQKLAWTSAAKVGLGTAADSSARLWFTLARGILTEKSSIVLFRPSRGIWAGSQLDRGEQPEANHGDKAGSPPAAGAAGYATPRLPA